MDICRHFLAGRCRFGNRCRFSHQRPDRVASRKRCDKCRSFVDDDELCSNCRPKKCGGCNIQIDSNKTLCPSCDVITCSHCHLQLKKGEKPYRDSYGKEYCPNCTPHECGYCIGRPGVKGRNIVRGQIPRDQVCCEECKDYYCIKHTSHLSRDYHKHVVCQECRDKCFYCEHRTKDPYNKKLKGEESCQDCMDYFCKAHNWIHAKDLELSSQICPECEKHCWACRGPPLGNKWNHRLICEKCAETYCPTCHPEEAKKVGNTFHCQKCTRLHGCELSVHGLNNQYKCTCDQRKRQIIERRLEKDLIHPDYEVLATYNVKKEEHDGYCSDHYNDRMIEKTVTEVYPLPINFTPENVDRSFYQRERGGCNGGSGYCYLTTTYTLTDLQVSKKGEGYSHERVKKKKHRRDYSWSTDEEYKERPRYRYYSSDSIGSTSTEED